MVKFQWLVGEWNFENAVPATRVSPAYRDIGSARYCMDEKSNWICMVAAEGEKTPQITLDPFSGQWIYMLYKGSYGILRSTDGWIGNRIVFSGLMTMIGVNCDWRMTWTRDGENHFSFVNEERNDDGSWAYIDEWRFRRMS